jgi:prolyl-tRNA editing enzyme YbaK/EbsC (Cys-tRNA(Pro) deacylase)
MAKNTNSVARVLNALEDLELAAQVLDLPASTRTAEKAAEAVGCHVSQIVKSLVFTAEKEKQPILILTSGSNRVNESIIASQINQKVEFANPDFVREKTGFAIGGVAPIGHINPIETFIDRDLLKYDEIWAAAGSPHTVFSIRPDDLVRACKGKIISVC